MLKTIFISLLIFGLFLFGINNDVRNLGHLTILAAIILGFIILISSKQKYKIPSHFLEFEIFVGILSVSWIAYKPQLPPFYYSILFIEGLLLWFLIYNFDNKLFKYFDKILFFLGIIYFIFYFLSFALNINLTKLASLFFISNQFAGHQQIGNLWVVILAFLIGNKMSEPKYIRENLIKYEAIFFLIGGYLLLLSKSRSAYLTALLIIIYMFRTKIFNKKYLYVVLIVITSVIIYVSLDRSILFSRPYFLQSIISFVKYPFGVGMGNFRIISENFYREGGFLGSFSGVTHNIFFEVLSGVGIFCLPFLFWYSQIYKDLKSSKYKDLAWVNVFVALSCLFFVDLSYVVPSMFLLWFISLGAMQKMTKKT